MVKLISIQPQEIQSLWLMGYLCWT